LSDPAESSAVSLRRRRIVGEGAMSGRVSNKSLATD
jgi:hypothetical protein